MTNRKRIFVLIFLLLGGLLIACSTGNEVQEDADGIRADGEAALGNRILVAYYSPDGQVREMAEIIRDYTGGVLQEIQATEVYPDNYDTLLIGFPVLYDQVPMEITMFLESFDLTGKKVLPFVVGECADLSEIQNNLTEFCNGAEFEKCAVISNEELIAPWLKQTGVFSELIQIRAGNDVLYGGLYQNQEAYEFAELLPMTVDLYIPAAFARAFNLDRQLSNGEYRTRTYEIGKIAYWSEGPAVAIFVDNSEPQTVVPVIHLGQIFSEGSDLAECEEITIERLEIKEQKIIE